MNQAVGGVLLLSRKGACAEMINVFAESLKPAIKEAFVEPMNEVLSEEGKTAKKVFQPKKKAKK